MLKDSYSKDAPEDSDAEVMVLSTCARKDVAAAELGLSVMVEEEPGVTIRDVEMDDEPEASLALDDMLLLLELWPRPGQRPRRGVGWAKRAGSDTAKVTARGALELRLLRPRPRPPRPPLPWEVGGGHDLEESSASWAVAIEVEDDPDGGPSACVSVCGEVESVHDNNWCARSRASGPPRRLATLRTALDGLAELDVLPVQSPPPRSRSTSRRVLDG
jgi:hypothetical protein